VTINDYPDGRLVISYNGCPLPYSKFDKVRQVTQGAIVDNKRLGAALSMIKQYQEQNGVHRSQHGPQRLDQNDSIFSRPSESMSALRKKRRAKNAAMKKATENIISLPAKRSVTSSKPVVRRSTRLPVDFDPTRPVASPDTFWECELVLMEQCNQEIDRERMLLNRRRYASRMRQLKLSRGQQPYKLAA
jgi:hypothetical protein